MTITPSLIIEAVSIDQRHGFSWWDSTIVAAAGADVLYSEDMQHGRDFDGLEIRDPFQTMLRVNEPRQPSRARKRR